MTNVLEENTFDGFANTFLFESSESKISTFDFSNLGFANLISSQESEGSLKRKSSNTEPKKNTEYLRRISMNIPKLDFFKNLDSTETPSEELSSNREKIYTDSSFDDVTSEISSVESPNIKGVLVSVWDNTLGPKLIRFWPGKHTKLDGETLDFVSKFPIFGELGREDDIGDEVEIKFNYMPDQHLMILTCYFQARYLLSNSTMYTISLILDKSKLKKFLLIQNIISDKMITLGQILKYLSTNLKYDVSSAMSELGNKLSDFVDLFDALYDSGIDEYSIKDTLFNGDITDKEDYEFLLKALTGHLMMHGHSVVVGDNVKNTNMWIQTLSLCLLQNEISLCQSVREKNCFIPEIQVQGLVVKSKTRDILKVVPIDSLMSSKYPISIIDIINKKVWIFQLYNYFIPLKENYFSNYPQSKHKLKEKNRQFRNNYQKLNHVSPLINQFVDLILFKVDMRLRKSFAQEWMKHFMKQSLLLIKYVEFESGHDLSKSVNMKDLRENLDLLNQHDLFIILSMAEKFKPGIYSLVQGDPQKEARNVIELFSDI
eukprot:gene1616-12741_t